MLFCPRGLTRLCAAQAKPTTGEDRLLVDAKEIIYNNDKNTIAASGDVQLNYQGRSLQADRVIYDRNTGRVYAEGHAKLTDEKGAVLNADRFELTDDFKSGFIDSLRLVQTSVDDGRSVTTRFSAPRAERAAGETTTFERGTYTACEPCKDHPGKTALSGRSKPPRLSTTPASRRSITKTPPWRSSGFRSPTCPISGPRTQR